MDDFEVGHEPLPQRFTKECGTILFKLTTVAIYIYMYIYIYIYEAACYPKDRNTLNCGSQYYHIPSPKKNKKTGFPSCFCSPSRMPRWTLRSSGDPPVQTGPGSVDVQRLRRWPSPVAKADRPPSRGRSSSLSCCLIFGTWGGSLDHWITDMDMTWK